MNWFIVNTKTDVITEFEHKKTAMKFYQDTCVNIEENNCWGIFLQRPHGFFDKK